MFKRSQSSSPSHVSAPSESATAAATDATARRKRLRQVELVARRLVDQQLAGQYQSMFKGRGMTFSEVRPYAPGDDVRQIDWNVSARMSDPFIKVFCEERELTLMIIVDVRSPMRFGSTKVSKLDLAAELAAVLSFSAIRNNDKVGLILFSDDDVSYIPAKKGRRHVMRLIDTVLAAPLADAVRAQEASHSVSGSHKVDQLQQALALLANVQKRRCITALISDFLNIDADNMQRLDKNVRILARRHDFLPIRIRDPWEDLPPDLGMMRFSANPGSLGRVLKVGRRERAAYDANRRAYDAKLNGLFSKHAVDTLRLTVGNDYFRALSGFFAKRRAARV